RGRPFEEITDPERDAAAELASLNDEQAGQAEHFAVIAVLVPVLLRIASRAEQNPNEAFSSGQQVASLCRQFASVSRLPYLWTSAADVFSLACREDSADDRLVELGNSFDAGVSPELRVLAYVGSAMHDSPFEAFCAQLICMRSLFGWFPPESPTY